MTFSFNIISSVAARPRHSDLKQEANGRGSGHRLRLRKPPDNLLTFNTLLSGDIMILSTKKLSFVKALYILIYLIAAFLAFDSLLTSNVLESFFSGFLLAGIIIHSSLTTEEAD